MVAAGYGAADKLSLTGGTLTGILNLAGNPPLTVPGPTTSGYVLTVDGSGNITLSPAAGGGGGVTLTPTAVKTGAYTTSAGEFVVCDTTSASFTVTLPTAPADKSVVGVKMVTTASSHTVTVACGGSDVLNKTGGSTSLTLSLSGQGTLLQYKSSGAIWYVSGDDLPLGQLDARYTQLAGDLGNTTASPTVAKIQGTTIATPTGGTTNYLRADGNWAAPSGGSGVALDTTDLPLALNATASHGTGSNGASPSDHVHPTTGVALLAGAAFTGNVSTTGTLAVTGNTTASGTLVVSKRVLSGLAVLTDGTTITVDASLGNTFRLTLTASGHTMGVPSNPTDGQMILFEITQGASAYTLAWASGSGGYLFPPGLPAPTITTTASYTDCVGFKYRSSSNVWRCLAISQGYSS